MLEHEGCWWSFRWGELAPVEVEVGLDGAVGVRVVKVQDEGRRVGERQLHASWKPSKVNGFW